MADELAAVLDLEVLDRNLYRGRHAGRANRRGNLYGGQVAAQALRAATHTVPAGRLPHSLHSYFLRPGRADLPVLLRVDRDRDGGSVSARRVVAIQDGEVIFSLAASFHAVEEGPELQTAIPEGIAPPGQLPGPPPGAFGSAGMFEVRVVSGAEDASGHLIPSAYWARTRFPLADDPMVHACVLTYLSDTGTGLAELRVREGLAGPSLDHAVWFHRHIRMDEWVLFVMRPLSASHNRGLYSGTMHNEAGLMGATIVQESLFRQARH